MLSRVSVFLYSIGDLKLRLLESDDLFLAYNTCLIGKREDELIHTEVTFRLVVVDNGVSTTGLSAKEECSLIKSCGVRLFHVNHEEVQTLSLTQPKICAKGHMLLLPVG